MIKVLLCCFAFAIMLLLAVALTLFAIKKTTKNYFICIPLVLSATIIAYWQWGGMQQWLLFLREQQNHKQIQTGLQHLENPAQLIALLQSRLAIHPQDELGWSLLGRLYARQNKWPQAQQAFAKAYQLQPGNEAIAIYYAQSLWEFNQHQFDAMLVAILQKVIANNPKQPDALSMLAMHAFLQQDYSLAINYWQTLLTMVSQHSDAEYMIRRALAKAREQQKQQ